MPDTKIPATGYEESVWEQFHPTEEAHPTPEIRWLVKRHNNHPEMIETVCLQQKWLTYRRNLPTGHEWREVPSEDPYHRSKQN